MTLVVTLLGGTLVGAGVLLAQVAEHPPVRPAFYLYAPLPAATVPGVYCGHGQDFSFTSNLDHTCFDWLCGQPHRACVIAGSAQHAGK